MQSQDAVEDLLNRKHGKKPSIAFMEYFSKAIRQKKEKLSIYFLIKIDFLDLR